jgi:uncharacterized protein YlxW (UPF0749 family)
VAEPGSGAPDVDAPDADEPSRRTPERFSSARPGLLEYVATTSLDPDYAHVAAERRRSPTPTDRRPRRPGLAALAVLAVFGILVTTAAVQTSRTADESASSRESLVEQVKARRAALSERRNTIRGLQRDIAERRASDLAETEQGRVLRERLGRLGLATGSIAARGPGVRVRVDDVPGATDAAQMVQAGDVQKLVNGLWQVGAEAISINGQRLTAISPIRDAGSAITVNFVSLRRPYTISAIGNSQTMAADLVGTAGGQQWANLQSIGLLFDVTTEDDMLLPAAKPVSLRSAHDAGRRR